MRLHGCVLSVALILTFDVSPARAQAGLDRAVGVTEWREPLVITAVDGQTIGILARAAATPMGFEEAAGPKKKLSIAAEKKTLREVLDAMVAEDARYEWRELDGVIVVRPVAAWLYQPSALHQPVPGVSLRDIAATELPGVLTRMVGVTVIPSNALADTQRFSLEIPKGAMLLDALNAVVRAHGTLAWAMQRSATGDLEFPTTLMLFAGSTGTGFGIPVAAPGRVDASTSLAAAGRVLNSSVFDRIVGPRPDGNPIVVRGVGSIPELATAVGVPMGFESLRPDDRRPVSPPGFDGITLTGMTLQNALATLIALDPRYGWRDLDGVIVFRPLNAWLDSTSPLFRSAAGLRLDDVTVAKAIGAFATLFDSPEHGRNTFPDTRTFSVDLAPGTALDVLNGIVRAHGELCWLWEELSPRDRQTYQGRRYHVMFSAFGGGGGLGFVLP